MKPRKRPNGNWYCQPVIDGKRRIITLGPVSAAEARSITQQIESLVRCHKYGQDLSASSKAWLRSISQEFRAKLYDFGLLSSGVSITFGQLLDLFLKDFRDGTRRPNTERRMETSTRTAREVFGETVVAEITSGQIAAFEQALKRKYQSTATWTKSLNDTKQVFAWGVRHKLIEESPIQFLRGGSMANDARMHYVGAETIEEVIQVAAGDWVLILSLARFAGLRIPSELYRLRWRDVNFQTETLRIYGQKTKQWRSCPIFPPLDRHLLAAWESLPDGTPSSQHVITAESRRALEANLRTTAIKLIERSGNDLWPKLFVNLRMSCATDLLNYYPVQKVASWLGHSVKILLRHYHGSSGAEIRTAKEQTPSPFLAEK